ncbi:MULTISPECIES: hypothetical protein [unclassified Paraburkholderia]|uniref:hypothetical protein n=1 Tax=unclassified Paraburkholderia TaxID=2615204 RepID=UPI002AB0D210|nr:MULTISPECIES: hypothetical protein [unclassified Paraburkholderia]
MNGKIYSPSYSRWIVPRLGVLNLVTLAVICTVVLLRFTFRVLRLTSRLTRKIGIAAFKLARRIEPWARS